MSNERYEELKGMTKEALREKAKELNVRGRWDMNKAQLITSIMNYETGFEEPNESEEPNVSEEAEVDERKMRYVENIELGTLVAFRLPNGRIKSAKVIRKSSKDRKLQLETDYGAKYIVSYEDIVWVRTGKRWPRGVYNLLKGITSNE